MADHSGIPYVDASWPVVVGCSRVSPGCDHCYAIRDARRMAGNPNPKISGVYAGLTRGPEPSGVTKINQLSFPATRTTVDWTGQVRCLEQRLDWPAKWRKPRRILVSSHGDLFHPSVPYDFQAKVLDAMAFYDWHTFIVLTKRAQALAAVLRRWAGQYVGIFTPNQVTAPGRLPDNIWPAVTAEDQLRFDERVLELLKIPARQHVVSMEPLLGPIDFRGPAKKASLLSGLPDSRVTWVIAGAESGSGRRHAYQAWFADIAAQCYVEDMPLFIKQMDDDTGKLVKCPRVDLGDGSSEPIMMLPGDRWGL